jgi:hypothetical protein
MRPEWLVRALLRVRLRKSIERHQKGSYPCNAIPKSKGNGIQVLQDRFHEARARPKTLLGGGAPEGHRAHPPI